MFETKDEHLSADFIFFLFTLTLEHAQIYNSILSITFTKKKKSN